MIIYLKHPVHGTKVAISHAEAEADEKNGWERFQEGPLYTPKLDAQEISVPVNALAKKKPLKDITI